MAISNAPVSLDDVDTVLSNLEGLCSEEQSWATADVGLEQCIQVSYHHCAQRDAAMLVMLALLTQPVLQHELPSPSLLALHICPSPWLLFLLSELLHSKSPLYSSYGISLEWRSLHHDLLGVHLYLNTLFPRFMSGVGAGTRLGSRFWCMQGPWNGAAESKEGMQLVRASSSTGSGRSSAPRPQRSPVGPIVPSAASRRGLTGLPMHQRSIRSSKDTSRWVLLYGLPHHQ